MIRYLTLALTLVAAAPALAGMQGNLPTPVQKLPAYPPVVCVAPNWTTVPCASRAPKPPAVKCLRPDGTEEPCESRQATPPLTTPVVKGAIIIPSMFEGVPTIQVHGEIVSGDETKFKAAIKDLGFPSEALVYLNSIGGNLEASLAIANTVWARRYHTMVGADQIAKLAQTLQDLNEGVRAPMLYPAPAKRSDPTLVWLARAHIALAVETMQRCGHSRESAAKWAAEKQLGRLPPGIGVLPGQLDRFRHRPHGADIGASTGHRGRQGGGGQAQSSAAAARDLFGPACWA